VRRLSGSLVPRSKGETLDRTVFEASRAITEPLAVDQTPWSFGIAFKWGELEPSHPLLQLRFVFQNPNGHKDIQDWHGNKVRAVGPNDVVGRDSHVLIRGLDTAVRKGLARLEASAG
jgi:hypothetical protein